MNYDICPECGGPTVEPDEQQPLLYCSRCDWVITITIIEREANG